MNWKLLCAESVYERIESPNSVFSTIAGISIKEKGTFYRYGSNFIYQCAEISEKLTIMDIIKKIVEDVNKIKSNEEKLKI